MHAYKICMVKDGNTKYPDVRFVNPNVVATLLHDYFGHPDREMFIVIACNTKNRLIGIHTASIGSLDTSIVHPREVFKFAILANAAAVILAHNHPSDDVTPSQDDIVLTKRLQQAGAVLGIQVLDHLVIGNEGGYYSFQDHSLMASDIEVQNQNRLG